MSKVVLLVGFAVDIILGAGGMLGDVSAQFFLLGAFVVGIDVLVFVSAAYNKSPAFRRGILNSTVRKITFLAKEDADAPAENKDLVKKVEVKSDAPAVCPGFLSINRSQVFNDLAIAESVLGGAW
jgi:hypothetical protein